MCKDKIVIDQMCSLYVVHAMYALHVVVVMYVRTVMKANI